MKCQSIFYLYVKYQVDRLGNKEVTIYPTFIVSEKREINNKILNRIQTGVEIYQNGLLLITGTDPFSCWFL